MVNLGQTSREQRGVCESDAYLASIVLFDGQEGLALLLIRNTFDTLKEMNDNVTAAHSFATD